MAAMEQTVPSGCDHSKALQNKVNYKGSCKIINAAHLD